MASSANQDGGVTTRKAIRKGNLGPVSENSGIMENEGCKGIVETNGESPDRVDKNSISGVRSCLRKLDVIQLENRDVYEFSDDEVCKEVDEWRFTLIAGILGPGVTIKEIHFL